jgi:agmatine deiminase
MSSLSAAPSRRWPAEWEPHQATLIAWPHQPEDWPGKFQPVPYTVVEVIRLIARGENVVIVAGDDAMETKAHELLAEAHVPLDKIQFLRAETNRLWTRDSGPIIVQNGHGLRGLHWKFNGWAKYEDHEHDQALAPLALEFLRIPSEKALAQPVSKPDHWIVLEGGSIEGNGAGCLLTTEECLLSPIQARNPELTKEDIEILLAHYLGIEKVLWLNRGIVGDDTHGHIDDLARFTDRQTIVTAIEPDPQDENYEPLQENLLRLRTFTDQFGHPFRIVTLPMPEPVFFNEQRLPASYANFYISNSATLVPIFHDKNDKEALRIIQELIPDRPAIPVACRDFVLGLGTLHCMTQQIPIP